MFRKGFTSASAWMAAMPVLLRVALALLMATWTTLAGAASPVTLLTIDGAIGPATADYVARGIAHAAKDGSQLVILQMDTPGGLDLSMRTVIKAILTSPVPVATYVAPGGARAASAGTYILYASHIAAMAPGTNLGAATPVQVGMPAIQPEPETPPGKARDERNGRNEHNEATRNAADQQARHDDAHDNTQSSMTRKQINDAAAYIRGLAQLRDRNADWAELAVREAVSLPANDALKLGVIDLIAPDLAALKAQLQGKTITVLGKDIRLETRDATIVDVQPDWRAKLLAAITSPGIALLLMAIGIYGLLFEVMVPGVALPGILGGICLLLALYALQLLPVNYAGLALILLGMSFMIAEAFLPSFGVLGLGGIAAFVTGALILVDTDQPGYGVPLVLVGAIALVSAVLLAATAGIALKSRRRAVVSGPDPVIGSVTTVLHAAQNENWVHLQGERWRVHSAASLRPGQKIKVVARKGLLLEVVPVNTEEKGE